jgi:hypothetical protein
MRKQVQGKLKFAPTFLELRAGSKRRRDDLGRHDVARRYALHVQGLHLGVPCGVDGHHVKLRFAFDHHKTLEESLSLSVPENIRAIDLRSFVGPQIRLKEP